MFSFYKLLTEALRFNTFYLYFSRRSPRGGKLPFSEGSNSDGSRVSGMSGGASNEANNKANISTSMGTENGNADNIATSSSSTTASTTLSNVSLRTNPFENFSLAMDTDRKYNVTNC